MKNNKKKSIRKNHSSYIKTEHLEETYDNKYAYFKIRKDSCDDKEVIENFQMNDAVIFDASDKTISKAMESLLHFEKDYVKIFVLRKERKEKIILGKKVNDFKAGNYKLYAHTDISKEKLEEVLRDYDFSDFE